MYKVEFNRNEMELVSNTLSKLDTLLWDCEKKGDGKSQADW
jgi:hypothetical protein